MPFAGSPGVRENITVRINQLGAIVRIKDAVWVELGAETYAFRSKLNGQPSPLLGVYQSPGASALQVASGYEPSSGA
jgi:multidrug efflux pump subunit AcrB